MDIRGFMDSKVEEDRFNDDFDLGNYMDYKKGIYDIEEENAEFEELDSSAEFH